MHFIGAMIQDGAQSIPIEPGAWFRGAMDSIGQT
jgi:hypothetical protein